MHSLPSLRSFFPFLQLKPRERKIFCASLIDIGIPIKFSKLSAVLDYSLLDQMVVDGFAKITNKSGKEMQSSQNGILQTYLMSGVVGLIILIIIIQQLG